MAKKSKWSLIILCAMLIAKYEQTYLQKIAEPSMMVALCQEVGGVFSGVFARLRLCPPCVCKSATSSIFSPCVCWSHLYYGFQHRLNDKHDNVHFQQKLQYIHEGQYLR